MTILNVFRGTVLASSLLLAACSPTAHLSDLPSGTATQYPLDTGDEIKVSAFGLGDFSGTYTIDAGGMIAMPMIGDVAAGGMTVEQLKQVISQQLTAKQIVRVPYVDVQVSRYRPFFVIGEVQKPGEYAFRPGMTVLNAVSMAGGYTFRAKTSKVAVVRKRGAQVVSGAANETALIQPGDTIRVFEGWF